MIIDTHVHIGNMLKFQMPEEMVIESMEKYGIDFSLVSNIDSTEVDFAQKEIPKDADKPSGFFRKKHSVCQKIPG